MKATADLSRKELVKILLRFNPFGGYCSDTCLHPGHSTEAYRKTVRKLRGEEE